jgi:hypothetical protein
MVQYLSIAILYIYVSRRKKVSLEMADQVGHDEKPVIPGGS